MIWGGEGLEGFGKGSINGNPTNTYILVGYHGEPKVNLFHNIRII